MNSEKTASERERESEGGRQQEFNWIHNNARLLWNTKFKLHHFPLFINIKRLFVVQLPLASLNENHSKFYNYEKNSVPSSGADCHFFKFLLIMEIIFDRISSKGESHASIKFHLFVSFVRMPWRVFFYLITQKGGRTIEFHFFIVIQINVVNEWTVT